MKYRLPLLFSVLMIFVLVLAACAPAADDGDPFGPTPDLESPGVVDPTPMMDPTPMVEPTQPVEATSVVETPAVVDPTEPVGDMDDGRDLNRVSELLDESVYTSAATMGTADLDDYRVGEIDSLLVNAQTGEIVYAVVQVHNAFGLDTEFVALPWSEMEVQNQVATTGAATTATDDVRVIANVDREVLARHPALTGDALRDRTSTAWHNDLFTFWSNEVVTLPQTGVDGTGQLFRVDDVDAFDIENTEGEDLGSVVEMILGPAMAADGQATTPDTMSTNQYIRYAVIGIGGFLGLGQELIAVPFDRLEMRADADGDRDTFILNIDRETLEQAPRYQNLDEIPSTRDAGWDTDIDTFWRNIGVR